MYIQTAALSFICFTALLGLVAACYFYDQWMAAERKLKCIMERVEGAADGKTARQSLSDKQQ